MPCRFLLCELNAEAKVCDLDLTPSVDENIVRLDVSVYAPKAVQEGHGLQTRLRKCPHFPLAHVNLLVLQDLCTQREWYAL